MAKDRTETSRKVYEFLRACEDHDKSFTVADLARASGLKESSAKAYLTKKLTGLATKVDRAYRVRGVSAYREEGFVRLLSQKQSVSADPRKPELQPNVEALVRKARESALLALQVYNNPTTAFKTEAYSVLMVIAWTALLHAIFERDGQKYFYTESDGSPKLVDGEQKAWELTTCANTWWKGVDSPVKRNLEFFVKLRNRVEHRYVPEIDATVAGECQALLLNFDDLLAEQFGTYYAIRESLAVPLQTSAVRTEHHISALRKLQAEHFKAVQGFVDSFRHGLTDQIVSDPRYCFRAYLVPKVGNHKGSADLALEFVRPDPTRPEEFQNLESSIALIRDRTVPVVNADLLRASDVVTQVAARLGKDFRMHHHTAAWKRYEVRPSGFDTKRFGECKREYCLPDARHRDYGYTKAWVDFLVEKLSQPEEYRSLLSKPGAGVGGADDNHH